MPRDIRDQCDGFMTRPRITSGFRNQASIQRKFLSLLEVLTKILDSFIVLLSLRRMSESYLYEMANYV
ncbi:hypothetical protein YC2023_059486 [Brassica napus]